MEAVGATIGIVVVLTIANWLIRVVLGAILGAGRAGIDTVTKGGNFADHWKRNTMGMGAFEMRLREVEPSGENPHKLIEIEGRGLIPVARRTSISFVTSLFDVTDPASVRPIVSKVEDFAEPDSIAFQFAMQPAVVQPSQGFGEWSRVGIVVPFFIEPPVSGKRKIAVALRLIDSAQAPKIVAGFVDPGEHGVIAMYEQQFDWSFTERGYEEARELTLKQKPLFVRLAMAVAAADGSFDNTEIKTISDWIARQLTMLQGDERENLKRDCNDALRAAYAEGNNGTISLSAICDAILEISEPSDRYEAIELTLDVMAADGVADAEEMKTIRQIAKVLEIDYDELQRMKDERLVKLPTSVSDNESSETLESLLGIEPEWSKEKVRSFLTSEFKKWNARLNNLTDHKERENVQARLDMISEARKKYA